MRRLLVSPCLAVALVVGAACREAVLVEAPPAPQNLAYELEPSGDPTKPQGILLVWDVVQDPNLGSYRIYSRGSSNGSYGLRGETTSNTYHDNGVPHLQYYVTAVSADGGESSPSNVITVDEYLQIEKPTSLWSISLNGAIHLSWTDNAYLNDRDNFKWYRVYSTGYDLNKTLCDSTWSLEGTTVSPEFLAAALPNGVPRCFAVSAVSVKGYESLWSPRWQDTPRPDARNVLVWAYDEKPAQSGFRFWDDVNANGKGDAGELGLVQDGNRTDIDFWVYRDPTDSTLWMVPEFAGTSVELYSTSPVADLTSIDTAAVGGYGRNMIEAVPTYGYVFQIVEGSGPTATVRYGGLRVTHVGRDYMIFDWSFQTDPGNPQLLKWPGPALTGSVVRDSR